MTRAARIPPVAFVAGAVPALLWIFYAAWNAVWTTPPSIGPLTPINGLYLAMLPGVAAFLMRRPRVRIAGQWPYLAFVAWVAAGAYINQSILPAHLLKALIVCGLGAAVAAHMTLGGATAQSVLAGGVMLTSIGLSAWTIGYALETGFQYRGGVPTNPNAVAVLIAPGLLMALAAHRSADTARGHGLLLFVVLASFYASLLLGSRGVLIALLVSGALIMARTRRSGVRGRTLAAGVACTIALAQVPAIPDFAWRSGARIVASLGGPDGTPSSPSTPRVASVASAAGSDSAGRTASLEPPVRPLSQAAMTSTALARFGEIETGSLNLRYPLWRATVLYAFSSVPVFLFGGGFGTSAVIAWQTNPVFQSSHNTYLQLLADTGVVGMALVALLVWQIGWALWRQPTRWSTAWLAVVTCWLVIGLTATVVELHVFWITIGAAAASTVRAPRSSETGAHR